ncbi:MAG: hypothetical protein QOD06_2382, partial [Candidatus Binatota bacterium]|nr:hypothetical protein [Candidatus Binatota bacterium]
MQLGRRMLAGIVLAFASAVPAHAQQTGIGCSWVLKTDPDTVNAAFPDDHATYWFARFVSVPGSRLVIRGRYPHARYFSFNAYDEPQRPVDAVADEELL